jgi:hypothetical protein
MIIIVPCVALVIIYLLTHGKSNKSDTTHLASVARQNMKNDFPEMYYKAYDRNDNEI